MRLVYQRLLQLVGLGAIGTAAAVGVYYTEQASDRDEAQKLSAQRMMGFTDADAVDAVTLVTPGVTFELKREDARNRTANGMGTATANTDKATWRITAPETAPGSALAETTSVEGLVRAALDLRSESKLDGGVQGTGSLSLFNLDPPRYSVTLHTTDGHEETLLVGKKNGFDGNLYVKRADAQAVGMVAGTFEYQVDKDLFKLREKRLVPCDGEQVKNFTITPQKAPAYTIERRDTGFQMLAPLDTQADDGQASTIAQALCGLRAKTFVREHTYDTELPRFGLGTPAFRVAMTLADGTTYALRLGTMTLGGETHYFAMPEGDGPVVELASDWAYKKLETPVTQLRDLHVIALEREKIEGLSLYKAGGEALTFVKRHDEADGMSSWYMTHPKNSAVQSAKVGSLIYKLWNLRAARIVDEAPVTGTAHKHGLEAPDLKIEFTGKDGQSLGGIAFSAPEGNERFATTDQAARIDAVATEVVDDIDTQADDYIQEPAASKD